MNHKSDIQIIRMYNIRSIWMHNIRFTCNIWFIRMYNIRFIRAAGKGWTFRP